jgi:hypothetical protein
MFILLPFSCHLPHPTGANYLPNLFHPPVLRFCRRKDIKDKKEKHSIFASLR